MIRGGVADLRNYMRELQGVGEAGGSLVPAVQRFAAKFAEGTGIAVTVQAGEDIRINDRLAAEAFQMITEALSNVRRHTSSKQAVVGLECTLSRLLLWIENEDVAAPDVLLTRQTSLNSGANLADGTSFQINSSNDDVTQQKEAAQHPSDEANLAPAVQKRMQREGVAVTAEPTTGQETAMPRSMAPHVHTALYHRKSGCPGWTGAGRAAPI